jgi:predicted PurR-regulated permease PerM
VIGGVIALFVGVALRAVVHEVSQLTKAWPKYRQEIISGKGWVGQLAVKTHLNTYVRGNTSGSGTGGPGTPFNIGLVGGVLGAGKLLISAISSLIIVLILSLYFMVTLPTVRGLWLRFIPASRRLRVAAYTDEAFLRVGGFVLGNILTSVVAGVGTATWAAIFGLPYPILLGGLVALLDLIPVVGSTVGGAVVALVGLTQGLPIAIATAAFYIVYRFVEDHLLNPLVMRRTVHISAGVSIVATLVGAALLGILGALVAIPVAATIQLVLEKVTFPSLEQM